MLKKEMNRRDFLKSMGYLLVGTLAFRFQHLIGFWDSSKKPTNDSLKEAKHYTSGKHLAG